MDLISKKQCFCCWGEIGLTSMRIIKVPSVISNLSFWGESVKRNGITMINKGSHFSNFYISVDPVYPGFCDRGSIVVGKAMAVWVLLSA